MGRLEAIFLYAGRWSAEKRIHLLLDALPESCALVIVGDSDAEYADHIQASEVNLKAKNAFKASKAFQSSKKSL